MSDVEVRTYAPRPDETERRIVRAIRTRFGLMLVLIAVFGAVYGMARGDHEGISHFARAATGILLVVIMAIVYRRTVARELATARSLQLAVSANLVRRVMAGVAPVEVARAEVAKLVDWPGRGLQLHGAEGRALLFVPEHLDGYAEIRETLGAWAPVIETGRKATLVRNGAFGAVLSITMLASWLGTGARDLRLAGFAGLALLAHLAAFAWMVARERNFTAHHKAAFAIGFTMFGGMALLQLAWRWLVAS